MGAQRHRDGRVIVDDLLAEREVGQGDFRLDDACLVEQRQRRFGESSHRPQHVATRQAHRGEGVGAGQRQDLPLGKPTSPPHIRRIAIRCLPAALNEALHVVFPEAGDLMEAQAQGAFRSQGAFERAVPVAGIDVGRPHLDAVLSGIAHELRGCIKAHRLGIEQRRAEDLGIVVLHPGRDIDQDRKARGMAFGKAVFAESFDLLETAVDEFLLVLVRQHSVDEIVLELVDRTHTSECGHRAAQLVGFGWRKVRAIDGDLHGLLLEQRHAVRPLQDFPELARIFDVLGVLAPVLQVRVHHAALDGAWSHDRHLDDQIIVFSRLEPRQHRHLRPALDLEHADRIGLA